MATRALRSVISRKDQQQQDSISLGLDFTSCDPFAVLSSDHPTTVHQARENDASKRSNTPYSPRKSKNSSHNEANPLVQGTKMKRSGSFKSFLPSKDLSKSPIKSPKKETRTLGGKPLKKSKSSTSLSTLLLRPRSSKGAKVDEAQQKKDKENQEPTGVADVELPTPIWAQFATTAPQNLPSTTKIPLNDRRVRGQEPVLDTPENNLRSKDCYFDNQTPSPSRRAGSKTRPKSECLGSGRPSTSLSGTLYGLRRSGRTKGDTKSAREGSTNYGDDSAGQNLTEKEMEPAIDRCGNRVLATAAYFDQKTKDLPNIPVARPASAPIDPNAIESAFEALLDTRNVPLATRDKMRSLDTNIKADFIKQDKAGSGSTSSTEDLALPYTRPNAGKRSKTDDGANEHATEQQRNETPKKSRPRSLTFTLGKGDQSPSKRHKSGLHQRTKSGASTPNASSKPLDPAGHGHEVSLFGKADKFTLPEQVIGYLQKVQQPQSVEIGKIQKLRQLLRNETVGWVDLFIAHGGMAETIDLLYRIIAVEWREEHEDTLLHETLLCLKALSTTSSAMSQISTIQSNLFPTLLKMLFDDERKGPSDYNTRTIIINLLFSYLLNSTNGTLATRAHTILGYLRDQSPPKEAQAPAFITSIYHPRPYRTWNKELNNLTKEVFWIFLHHHNIVPYPPEPTRSNSSYQERHFPKEHPPVPAAPYIGGVEWDATAYLTAHLDLINGLVASLSPQRERNKLRQEMKDSGFEKLMGASFRTCKEKFYGSVHEALSVWVGAAREDGWPDKDVRQGPPKEETVRSPVKKAKKRDQPPKLEMPKLGLGAERAGGTAAVDWL